MSGQGVVPEKRSNVRLSASVLLLLLSNVVPLYGVLFLGWTLKSIMFLYWLESAVIGFYTIFKIIVVAKLRSVVMVPFFIIHYGAFMYGHLIFITFFFLQPKNLNASGLNGAFDAVVRDPQIIYALAALFVSHGISFFVNFIGNQEYETIKAAEQMAAPYRRIIVMHLTIIFGAFLTFFINAGIAPLLVMIAIKIVTDVSAHMREHGISIAMRPMSAPTH